MSDQGTGVTTGSELGGLTGSTGCDVGAVRVDWGHWCARQATVGIQRWAWGWWCGEVRALPQAMQGVTGGSLGREWERCLAQWHEGSVVAAAWVAPWWPRPQAACGAASSSLCTVASPRLCPQQCPVPLPAPHHLCHAYPPPVHPRQPLLPCSPRVRGLTVLEAVAPLAVACSVLQIRLSPQPAFISGCDVPPPPHPICTVPPPPCTPSCISCLAQPCSGVPGACRGSVHCGGTVGTSSSPLVSPHRGGSLPSCLAPAVSQGGP